MGLIDSPLRRSYGAEKKTSDHVVCECEASATLRHTSLDSFSLTLSMLELYIWGQSGTIIKVQGSHDWDVILRGTTGLPKPTFIGTKKGARTH
jgi:hypothetical protein